MQSLLDRVHTIINSTLKSTHEVNTVTKLLDLGILRKDDRGYITKNGLKVRTIFDHDASIVVGYGHAIGDSFPTHVHEYSSQHIMGVRGRFMIDYNELGKFYILNPGESHTIPATYEHAIVTLDPDSMFIAVCVPIEPAYKTGESICQEKN